MNVFTLPRTGSMHGLFTALQTLHLDEEGITSTEYVILLVLIACASIVTVMALAEEIGTFYQDVHSQMSSGEVRGGLAGVHED